MHPLFSTNDLSIGWVVSFKRLSGNSIHPLVVDEELKQTPVGTEYQRA